MYGFVFPAEPAKLTECAARNLNAPSQGQARYLPVASLPWVLITFTHIGKLFSKNPPLRDVGWTSETEVAVWLFTPDRTHARLRWFTPYAFVDLPLGIMHGREIYGAARDIGWFGFPHDTVFPRDSQEPQGLTLDAFGATAFGPDEEWHRYRLLSIARTEPTSALAEQWRAFADASGALSAHVAALWPAAVTSRIDNLWHPEGTTVFLKQLYDAADSSAASYQALVEVTTHVPLSGFRGGGLLSGHYTMDLHDSDTHPIARDLGLVIGTQPATFGYWLDFDFELEAGKEAWRAHGALTTPSPSANAPRYVDRWEFGASPQPFDAKGVTMYGFAFAGDHDKMQRLCDRYLNEPFDGNVSFQVFGSYLLVTFNRIERLVAQHGPYATCGSISETELAVWIAVRPTGSGALPVLAMFPSYLFVDNPLAVTQGRELYGFDKEAGRFNEFWQPHNQARRFSLQAQTVEHFSLDPCPHASWMELLSVSGEPAAPVSITWRQHDEAVHHLNQALAQHQMLTPNSMLSDATGAMAFWPPHGTQVYLKQFPDAADGSRACYQALISADVTVSAFRGGGFLGGEYTLTVHPCDSHPLFKDLGLATGARPLFGYWFDFDFVCEAGREIVCAGSLPRAPGLVESVRRGVAALLPNVAGAVADKVLGSTTPSIERPRRDSWHVPTLADPPLDANVPTASRRRGAGTARTGGPAG